MHPSRGPIIIDFGIAKGAGLGSLTESGVMIGTPSFMSPEQLSGKADHRSDIHALGLLICFCLTGNPPLSGDNVTEIVGRLLKGEIDLPELPISPQFRQIIVRSIRRNPGDRYQHAADFIKDLKETPEAQHGGDEDEPDWQPGPFSPDPEDHGSDAAEITQIAHSLPTPYIRQDDMTGTRSVDG
jgi:serine/threonine protein kinase